MVLNLIDKQSRVITMAMLELYLTESFRVPLKKRDYTCIFLDKFTYRINTIRFNSNMFQITRLKIARNPFAKGFREAGKCR